MTYTYQSRSSAPLGKYGKRKAQTRVWLLAGACAAAICALLIWIAVEICSHTHVVHSAGGQLPSNTVNMHSTYIGNVEILSQARG